MEICFWCVVRFTQYPPWRHCLRAKRLVRMASTDELLQAIRRLSSARQRLTDARKALQAAETEMIAAQKQVEAVEQAERKELLL